MENQKLTAQEVFDTVVNALRVQGRKSVNSNGVVCRYRSLDGCKCAAGHLIEDDEYVPEMEGKTISCLLTKCDRNYVPSLVDRLGKHKQFIRELQIIHDRSSVSMWENKFAKFAKKNNLIYTPRAT